MKDASRLTDEDFRPPAERTFPELVASIQHVMATGECDGETIEDFRLFITARLFQGATQSNIEDELIAWGMRTETAIELVGSTRTQGNGTIEFNDVYLDGIHLAREIDPASKATIRAANRAGRRERIARRMVELEQNAVPVDLGYEPTVSPYMGGISDRQVGWTLTLIAVIAACALAAILVGIFLF